MGCSVILQAPFPWFGGKSRAADIVWSAFGDVPHYVEPFAGSLAVLLARPTAPRLETVNDLDCYLANFWRAVSLDPEAVAAHTDWPVNEADLSARHQWLVDQAVFRERMAIDPDYFDARVAGWWVWGLCAWIGSGWCDSAKYRDEEGNRKFPHLGNAGRGVNRQLPHLSDAGQGVNRQLPHLGNAGQGVAAYFAALGERLRNVRVACGDWRRVLGANIGANNGIAGIMLDPPYAEGAADYGVGGTATGIDAEVREWAIANGDNPRFRIALCGYEGHHAMPDTWQCVPWKARKGYSSQGADGHNGNGDRERVWLSPHCLGVRQRSLFDGAAE